MKYAASKIYSTRLEFLYKTIPWKVVIMLNVCWSLGMLLLFIDLKTLTIHNLNTIHIFYISSLAILGLPFFLKMFLEYNKLTEILWNEEKIKYGRKEINLSQINLISYYKGLHLKKVIISESVFGFPIYLASELEVDDLLSRLKAVDGFNARIVRLEQDPKKMLKKICKYLYK